MIIIPLGITIPVNSMLYELRRLQDMHPDKLPGCAEPSSKT